MGVVFAPRSVQSRTRTCWRTSAQHAVLATLAHCLSTFLANHSECSHVVHNARRRIQTQQVRHGTQSKEAANDILVL